MDTELLTRKEAARYLKVKPAALAKMESRKVTSPHCWLNGRPRYRIEDLNKMFTTKPAENVS